MIAVVGFVGCSKPTATPAVVGTYVATNAEALRFLPDTTVVHERTEGGALHRVFVGFTRTVRGAPGRLEIWKPDSSPFVGTTFEIDTNFTEITVEWDDPRPDAGARQTHYIRKSGAQSD